MTDNKTNNKTFERPAKPYKPKWDKESETIATINAIKDSYPQGWFSVD